MKVIPKLQMQSRTLDECCIAVQSIFPIALIGSFYYFSSTKPTPDYVFLFSTVLKEFSLHFTHIREPCTLFTAGEF